jgi:hypothetical protein
MPNQLNFPIPLTGTVYQRPNRFRKVDLDLLEEGKKPILFGTSRNDTAELWVYTSNGSIAGHITLKYNDASMTTATVIDSAGAGEVLNVDMKDVLGRMGVQPGRYALVMNFFRNEVGSEGGYKLFISEISEDRTSVLLRPVHITPDALDDIYSFVVPSVPKQFAKGLADQLFGEIAAGTEHNIDAGDILEELNTIMENSQQRIEYAETKDVFNQLMAQILHRTYLSALDNMAADFKNDEIQYIEFEAYVEKALDSVIYSMRQSGEIDLRFDVR